jgi:hypothetical protein
LVKTIALWVGIKVTRGDMIIQVHYIDLFL